MVLSDDTIVTLDGIRIPDQYSKETSSDQISYNLKAKSVLEDTFKGKNARAFTNKKDQTVERNRLGQIPAQVKQEESGLWAQKLLLESGLARAWPSITTAPVWQNLIRAEQVARISQTGLWSDPKFAVQSPEEVKENPYNMQIVKGVVRSVATIRNNIYLNFGQNWREDFTIMIPTNLRKDMSQKKMSPIDWQGKTIEVRGFVESYNGPMIKITDIDQMMVYE